MAISRRQGAKSNRSSARYEPYPSVRELDLSGANKENQAPSPKFKDPKEGPAKEPARSELPSNYLDIPLEEIKGEVPVYVNAAAIRRGLNKLVNDKKPIPGTNKTFNKTSLSKELCTLAQKHHPIETYQGFDNHGPSVPALTRFLKKSKGMGGGDSEAYYFGNMLLEKLRIWNGEKKTKAREKAEKEFPNGRVRCDPDHMWLTMKVGEAGPSYSELSERGR